MLMLCFIFSLREVSIVPENMLQSFNLFALGLVFILPVGQDYKQVIRGFILRRW
jgi:hypothetical protein